MSIFNFSKKNETKIPVCTCNCSCSMDKKESLNNDCCSHKKEEKISGIKVLGSGCKSCKELYENAKQAVKDMGLGVEVEYITDMKKVMEYGVMSMPALVVNEKVVSAGKVLKAADVEKLLCNNKI